MGAFIGQTWPGAVIPYEIDPNFVDIRDLRAAISEIEGKSNLRFVRRQDFQDNFVRIQNHSSICFSQEIGMGGGSQTIECSATFDRGSLAHELCHAAGMIHEHARSDRDAFIRIIDQNISPDGAGAFEKTEGSRNHTDYDFGSIMHYPPVGDHSIDSRPAFEPVNPSDMVTRNDNLSAGDELAIRSEYPTLGVVRRSDSSQGAGRIRSLAVVQHPTTRSRVVTAVETAERDLRVIQWSIDPSGGVTREMPDSEDQARTATDIGVAARPSAAEVVTACRTANGRLKLIRWSVPADGVERLGDSRDQAGVASLIRIEAVTQDIFVTAVRTATDDLKLITWRLVGSGGVERLSDSGNEAGAVSEIAMTETGRTADDVFLATTVRGSSGRAKVIVWGIRVPTGAIERLGDSGDDIGDARMIATALAPTTPAHLCVACRTAQGHLRVIALEVSADGNAIDRRGHADFAGVLSGNSIVHRPYGAISAISTEVSRRLKLVKWLVDNGGNVFFHGESGDQAGTVGLLSLTGVAATNAPLATPVQTNDDRMDVLTWDDMSSRGELF